MTAPDHAVERRGDLPVAGAERHHDPALVHLLAEPLGEAALADAGLARERRSAAVAAALDDVAGDLEQPRCARRAGDERAPGRRLSSPGA